MRRHFILFGLITLFGFSRGTCAETTTSKASGLTFPLPGIESIGGAWSPDSKSFAFWDDTFPMGDREYRKETRQLIVVPDVSRQESWTRTIKVGPIFGPNDHLRENKWALGWAPDNSRVALAFRSYPRNNMEIQVFRPADGALMQQVEFDLPSFARVDGRPELRLAWSPDPNCIVVSCSYGNDSDPTKLCVQVIDLKRKRVLMTLEEVREYMLLDKRIVAEIPTANGSLTQIKILSLDGKKVALPLLNRHGSIDDWKLANGCIYVLQQRGHWLKTFPSQTREVWDKKHGYYERLRMNVFREQNGQWTLDWAREFDPGLRMKVGDSIRPFPDENVVVNLSWMTECMGGSRPAILTKNEFIPQTVVNGGEVNVMDSPDAIGYKNGRILLREAGDGDYHTYRLVWFDPKTKKRTFYKNGRYRSGGCWSSGNGLAAVLEDAPNGSKLSIIPDPHLFS